MEAIIGIIVDFLSGLPSMLQFLLSKPEIFYLVGVLMMIDHVKTSTKLLILFITRIRNTAGIHSIKKQFFLYESEILVLIPAYNAKKVDQTIASVINTTYQNMKIIVIVNGSDKQTFKKAVPFEDKHPNLVKTLYLKRKGKSVALNHGLKWAHENLDKKADIIITLDADSKITNPQSFRNIVRTFENDSNVIAMSGDIQICPGDNCKNNIWSRLQALEYLLAMHIGKRFQAIFNSMLIIPGGFAVFRAEYLPGDRPFNENNITEDFSVSLDVHAYGKKIVFEPGAVARFDCPENYEKLKGQRIRWAHGQMDTLTSFLHIFHSPTYNTNLKIAISNMWLFEVILNFIWIGALVYYPASVIYHVFDPENGSNELINLANNLMSFNGISDNVQFLLIVILLYPILEIILVLYAVWTSGRRECLSLVLYIPILIFIYRPLLRFARLQGHIKKLQRKQISWEGKNCQKEIITIK